MDSLANYGSDDEYEYDNSHQHSEMRRVDQSRGRDSLRPSPPHHQSRRDDDTNYDDVTMDMSEDSFSGNESPRQVAPSSRSRSRDRRSPDPYHKSNRDTYRDDRRDSFRDERRKSPANNHGYEEHNSGTPRRGLLGDRPGDSVGPGLGSRLDRGLSKDSGSKGRDFPGGRDSRFEQERDDARGNERDSRKGGLGSDSRGGLGSNDFRGGGLGSNDSRGGYPPGESRGGLGSNDFRGGGLASDSRGLGSDRRGGGLGSDRDKSFNSDRGSKSGFGSDRGSGGDRGQRGGLNSGGLGSSGGSMLGNNKPPSLMDLKPFGGGPPPASTEQDADKRGRDNREPRNEKEADRDRRYKDNDRDKERSNERDKDRHDREKDRYGDRDRRYDDKRSSNTDRRRERSKSREKGYRRRSPSGERDRDRDKRSYPSRSGDSRRSSSYERKMPKRSHSPEKAPASGDYKPSYKVSKKLQAMEKMGLQIKTPDGSMATAQMLMQRSLEEQVDKVRNATGIQLPKYYNPAAMNPLKYAEQKRKLLWGNRARQEGGAEGPAAAGGGGATPAGAEAANKWQGAKFAQDNDGKVASKFLRLMGVKDPSVTAAPVAADSPAEIVRKQEEMFEAMQAQYDVARATTHTMRGVGLGFSSAHRNF